MNVLITPEQARAELLGLLKRDSFQRKRVVLASGKTSDYYLDARVCSLSGRSAYLIASLLYEFIKNDRIEAVGGLTLGADPIIGSLIAYSAGRGTPLNGFIVRKEEKKHGMGKLLEGPALKPTTRVVILDDVVTTGSSTVKAIEAIKNIGCPIVRVLAIVDRDEGGREAVAKFGLTLESLFTIADFLKD